MSDSRCSDGAGQVMYNASLKIIAALAWTIVAASQAVAQGAAPSAKPEMTQSCPGLVAVRPPFAEPAALRLVALERDQVRISYVGHSTFLIESAGGVTVATDYAGYAGADVVPSIVTMNHAHQSHYTDTPDPRIEYVLRGWNPDGGAVQHTLTLGDVLIRNVPTDIRSWKYSEAHCTCWSAAWAQCRPQ